MKTFVPALLVALAGVASAQISNLPQCSLQCFLTALGSDGCSELTDFKCHCQKSDALFASVTPCVQKACSADDQAEVISGVESTCSSAGVPISVPSPSAASSAASSAVSSAVSSAASAASSAVSSYEASVSSAVSSVLSSVASEASSAASSAASTASAVPLPSANGTVPSSTPSPTSTSFPGAATRVGAAAGFIGAAAFAVLAL